MRWREYPDRATRDQDAHGATGPKAGAERTGTEWSAGPGPGTHWVAPDDDPGRFALVHTAAVEPARYWSITTEDWQRQPFRSEKGAGR